VFITVTFVLTHCQSRKKRFMNKQNAILLKMFVFAILMGFVLILPSCTKQDCEETVTYRIMDPNYTSFEELRSAVDVEGPRVMENPGKLMILGDWIFVSELREGVHVIDNSNPESPTKVSFINIPGNVDLASRNGRMYCDSYTDLLTFDVNDPTNITLTSRTENAFEFDWDRGIVGDPTLGVATSWTERLITETRSCNLYQIRDGDVFFNSSNLEASGAPTAVDLGSGNDSGVKSSPGEGVVGSTARFSIVEDFLYTISSWDLNLFSLSNPDQPVSSSSVSVGWSIETLWPYKNSIFIGSQSGMFVYDVSNPANPTYRSEFNHARGCDPVVVDDKYAYVTIRTGGENQDCGGWTDQLDVINIENLDNPWLVQSFEMSNPHGLAIDDANDKLYICDGDAGLKVFDAADVNQIGNNLLQQFNNIQASDVISLGDRLFLIGEDGFYQYKVAEDFQVTELSSILIGQ